MKIIRRFLRSTGFALAGLAAFILLYLASALILTLIPVNGSFEPRATGIRIFIKSNGVHTDVIVPVETGSGRWTEFVPLSDFQPSALPFRYLAFGWGNREFYLNTPSWADLKLSTAFRSVFMATPSALHLRYLENEPASGPNTRSIIISEEQYAKLIEYLRGSFRRDQAGKIMHIHGYHYAAMHDGFYEANGSYSLLTTCNEWTNSALAAAGIKTAAWAPFDRCVLYHFD